jgi:hypothetical protein
MRIPRTNKIWHPLSPRTVAVLGGKGSYFQKLSKGFKTSDMTSVGLGEMSEGDSTDTCGGICSFMSMGDQAEGLAIGCADPGARPPISVSGFFFIFKL